MIEQDEAVTIAAGVFAEGARIGAYPFEDGFVLWAEEPPRADPALPPESVGAGCLVVDRVTGDVSYWPPLPATLIAERYGAQRRTGSGE